MNKYLVGFIAGLLLVTSVAFAATFSSWTELKTAITDSIQLKRATAFDTGDQLGIVKIEGIIQDLTGVRDCEIYNLTTAYSSLSDNWESHSDFRVRVPAIDFSRYEYLCWPVWVTAIYLDTTQTVAINLTTNEPLVLEPNTRCDTARPFNGGNRTGDFTNWFFLQVPTNDSNIVAKCLEQTGPNVTVGLLSPNNEKVYYSIQSSDGLTVSKRLLGVATVDNPSFFLPVVGSLDSGITIETDNQVLAVSAANRNVKLAGVY